MSETGRHKVFLAPVDKLEQSHIERLVAEVEKQWEENEKLRSGIAQFREHWNSHADDCRNWAFTEAAKIARDHTCDGYGGHDECSCSMEIGNAIGALKGATDE